MHDEPHLEGEGDRLRQHRDERLVARGDRALAPADAESGAQGSELRQVVVGSEAEERAVESEALVIEALPRAQIAIEADEMMAAQLVRVGRRAEASEIAA